MKRKNWWMFSIVILAMVSLINACFGNDEENATKAKSNDNRSKTASNDDGAGQSKNEDIDAADRAALGVAIEEYDGHVRVKAIMPGSPASKAGLRVDDEIRAVGDQKIGTAEGLAEEIREYQPGQQVELSIRRNGERQTLTANLASRQQLSKAARSRSQQDSQRRDTSYSYRADGQPESARQLHEQVRSLQQQVSRLQQEVDELQAPKSTRHQDRSQRNYSSTPQDANNARAGNSVDSNGQRARMIDRTGQRYSTSRGFSRDHGPRETGNGNNANED